MKKSGNSDQFALFIQKDMGLFLMKNHLLMLWHYFWSEKMCMWICSIKFFFWGIALSTIWLPMAYCCHFSTAAPNFFFDMLGKLQKGVSGHLVLSFLLLLIPWFIVKMCLEFIWFTILFNFVLMLWKLYLWIDWIDSCT